MIGLVHTVAIKVNVKKTTKICTSKDRCVSPEGPELASSGFYNLASAKDSKQPKCKACQLKYQKDHKEAVNVKNKKWKHDNSDKVKASNKIYRANNKEKIAVKNKKWSDDNPKKRAIITKRYRQANLDERRASTRAWNRDNPEKKNFHGAKRRAAKLQRTVSWANLDKIKQIYIDCEEINLAARAAGCTDKFSVDHIIPMQGELVSGLHVENNLQIITLSDNSSKGNTFYV